MFLFFGHFSFRRKKKQAAVTNITNRQHMVQLSLLCQLDVSYETTYIVRSDGHLMKINVASDKLSLSTDSIRELFFTITAEILVRSLANFYCQ